MIKYPMHFSVRASSEKGMQTTFQGQAEDFESITCAVPPVFGGPGGGYSPEDLYSLSLLTCFIATFKVFAEKTKFEYRDISGEAILTIDRDEKGTPWLQKVVLNITLKGVADQEKAKKLCEDAGKYCLVSNSVKSEKVFNYTFE